MKLRTTSACALLIATSVLQWAHVRLRADDNTLAHNSGGQDVILLLPAGPLHIRIEIVDGGQSLQQLRTEYTRRLMTQLDVDQDGLISRSETTNHPLFVTGRRFTDNKFLDSLRGKKPYSDDEIKLAVDRAAGQLVAFRQNEALVDQDLSVFRVIDEDQSGLIERVEMRTAVARIAARDIDFDQTITFDEFLDQAVQPDSDLGLSGAASEPPPSILSELMRNAAEPIMAPRLVRMYDHDKDAHLSATELGWTQERCAELDNSQDGLLNVQELTKLRFGSPDLNLKVDLSMESDISLKLLASRSSVATHQLRNDVVSLQAGELSMSIGYRARDPLAEAEQNARNLFNAIDGDANGYLDRDEVANRQLFERYLFDAMDSDGDDRVFASEMFNYVRAYTEPASTSCQITLFDMGSGFFQTLDSNSDGRISIRELRQIEQNLLAACNDNGMINPSRAKKAYRIEIQRGGVSLFGRVDRPEVESPAALLKPPSGPVWFQRMDRNSDGDLTWDEFLGPREVFHRLDIDQDGLIDADEARTADSRS